MLGHNLLLLDHQRVIQRVSTNIRLVNGLGAIREYAQMIRHNVDETRVDTGRDLSGRIVPEAICPVDDQMVWCETLDVSCNLVGKAQGRVPIFPDCEEHQHMTPIRRN